MPRLRETHWGSALLVSACLLQVSCDNRDGSAGTPDQQSRQELSETVERIPFAARPAAAATRFVELGAAETGIDFTNPIDEEHPLRYLYSSSMSTGGAAIADFDGDGKQDVFLASGPNGNKLFRQTSRMRFEDVTERAGVDGGDHWAVGCAFADIDNDGDSDLYVCNYVSANQLFLNNGDGTFTESAQQWGVDFVDASHTPSFCDYDGDGDLDLYVLTNRWYRPEGFPDEQTLGTGPDGKPQVLKKFERYYAARQNGDTTWESMVVGRPDILCRNDGGGKFEVVNEGAGIKHRGHGLSATWWDWNGDGWTDLWVGNDFQDQDCLYVNRGDGTFVDVATIAVGHLTWFSMGADFGDLNGDGLADFLIADMAGSTHYKQKTAMGSMDAFSWFMDNARPPQLMRNAVFLNAGNGRFLEGAYLAGLASTDWTWAARLCDFDHDGREDAFFQCGMSRNFNERDDEELKNKDRKLTQWERYRHLPPMKEKNRAYRNLGDMKFADVSKEWGVDHLGMSYGCAVGDLDGDGALDIVSVRLDDQVAVYHNTGADAGNSLSFSFRGETIEPPGHRRAGAAVHRWHRGESAAGPHAHRLARLPRQRPTDPPFRLGEAEDRRARRVALAERAQPSAGGPRGGGHYIVTESGTPWERTPRYPGAPMFSPAPHLSQFSHPRTGLRRLRPRTPVAEQAFAAGPGPRMG